MSEHKQRLVREATRLFGRDGFHAVSLDAILTAAATTKTTFYKHFESKDELALVCLRGRDGRWRERLEADLETRGAAPADRLRGFFCAWHDAWGRGDFDGLLVLGAAAEFPRLADDRHRAARESLASAREMIEGLARDAGVDRPTELAEAMSLVLEGAVLHEIMHGDGSGAALAGRIADTVLDDFGVTAGEPATEGSVAG